MIGKMAKLLTGLRRNERGSATVEAGFSLVILVLLMVGVIEVGRFMWINTSLSHAAREAARYGSRHAADSPAPVSTAQLVRYAKSKATGVDPKQLQVTITYEPVNASGSEMTIIVRYPYDSLLSGLVGMKDVLLSARTVVTLI